MATFGAKLNAEIVSTCHGDWNGDSLKGWFVKIQGYNTLQDTDQNIISKLSSTEKKNEDT